MQFRLLGAAVAELFSFGEEEHGRSEVSLRAVSLISNHLGDDATALCGIPIECLLLVDRVHQGTQE